MKTVSGVLKLPCPKGRFGIEIEAEGMNLPKRGSVPREWREEADGSLVGEAREYVLKEPCSPQEVEHVLGNLWNSFEEGNTKFFFTGRAGIHVHLNVGDVSPTRMVTIACLYLLMEDLFVKFCGKEREGNLFCLRMRDADYLLDILVEGFRQNFMLVIGGDRIRYASINFSALMKYGSLEFRSMRFTDNKEEVILWIKLIRRLFLSSQKFKDPVAIVEDFSQEGAIPFFKKVLGVHADIPAFADIPQEELRDILYEGVRRIQDIAFCRDWSTFTGEGPLVQKELEVRNGGRIHFDELLKVPVPADLADGNVEDILNKVFPR